MMSCLLSKGARDNEDAQSFGYRYDDDLTQRFADPTSGTIGKTYNAEAIPGFTSEMVVGFKPMLGLFNQFKHFPFKACPLVLELELVSNFTDCIFSPDVSGDFPAIESAPNTHQSTSGEFELNNCFLQCDVVSLDSYLHNKHVSHLLDGKELPYRYITYICQSNSVVGQATSNNTVVCSVSKLIVTFITFYKADPAGGATEVHKEYKRFYHPSTRTTLSIHGNCNPDNDLEFQLQLGSKLFPEYPYPCKNITQAFYYLRKALNLPLFHQHHLSIEFNQYKTDKFIFAINMEKVPDSSYTGVNTKAGQQLLIRVKPSGSMDTSLMPDTIYITLVPEQILSIRDAGVQILD